MRKLRLKDFLMVGGGIALIALSLSFTHVEPVGGAGSAPVTVVNTPLPVQGTVNVANFPASNNVTLNPATQNPVTVVNPADIAKALGIQHPYQKEVLCQWPNDNNHCDVSFTSPTNQRLVFEYISGQCNLNPGMQILDVNVITIAGGARAVHNLGIVNPAGGNFFGNVLVSFGQTVRLYADQGTQVEVTVLESNVGNNLQVCTFALSGQAVNVP